MEYIRALDQSLRRVLPADLSHIAVDYVGTSEYTLNVRHSVLPSESFWRGLLTESRRHWPSVPDPPPIPPSPFPGATELYGFFSLSNAVDPKIGAFVFPDVLLRSLRVEDVLRGLSWQEASQRLKPTPSCPFAEVLQYRVFREGSLVLLPVSRLVQGDIVCLQAGEQIPADIRFLGTMCVDEPTVEVPPISPEWDRNAIQVSDIQLTGENWKLRKNFLPGDNLSALVTWGSSGAILQGCAVAVVLHVGEDSLYAAFARDGREAVRPDQSSSHQLEPLCRKWLPRGIVLSPVEGTLAPFPAFFSVSTLIDLGATSHLLVWQSTEYLTSTALSAWMRAGLTVVLADQDVSHLLSLADEAKLAAVVAEASVTEAVKSALQSNRLVILRLPRKPMAFEELDLLVSALCPAPRAASTDPNDPVAVQNAKAFTKRFTSHPGAFSRTQAPAECWALCVSWASFSNHAAAAGFCRLSLRSCFLTRFLLADGPPPPALHSFFPIFVTAPLPSGPADQSPGAAADGSITDQLPAIVELLDDAVKLLAESPDLLRVPNSERPCCIT